MPDKSQQPAAAPPVVDRGSFDAALAEQVGLEKELTRHGDRVSASRRRLPMVEVENYRFDGEHGPVTLTELFGDTYLLLVQNFMFGPDWEKGCPSCTFAADNLPFNMERLDEEAISFAMISHAPVKKLKAWRAERGWPYTWVSSYETSYHDDWEWNSTFPDGSNGPVPGYSYYLLKDGVPYLTYTTRARGTEAILPVAHIMDRTAYGRQQDWEDSPTGWPQYPTYG